MVLDPVGGGAIGKRNLAGLVIRDRKRVLEAAVTLPEFIKPALLRFDTLTIDLLPVTRWAGFMEGKSDELEIVIIIGTGGPRSLLGAIPGRTGRGLSGGVLSGEGE